MEIPLSI